MKVRNMKTLRGRDAANQFIIEGATVNYQKGTMFQSYDSIIAFRPSNGGSTMLDKNYWDYSATTGKYRNQFLGVGIEETRKRIESGKYILTDLNGGE